MDPVRPRPRRLADRSPGWRRLSAAALAAGLAACAAPRPVLYPNARFEAVGEEGARQDVAECGQMAKAAGATPGSGQAGEVAAGTAAGAGLGAAGGAAGGAIVGAAASGAGIGAVSGAVTGVLAGLFRRSPDRDSAYRHFVERCLRERGYEPMGWK